jgi:thioredoxin reductase (NADPH)
MSSQAFSLPGNLRDCGTSGSAALASGTRLVRTIRFRNALVMELKGRFVISRKDQVSQVDDIVIESEGLTIGRLIGNDLVLNNRAVSRTHAGIKRVHDEYWLFNLSESNGTILNGQLVARCALADGDVVQIGSYLLRINYAGGGIQDPSAGGAPSTPILRITVEMELQVQPLQGRQTQPQAGGLGDSTIMVSIPRLFDKEGKPLGAARRPGMTGLLTGLLPSLDDQALNAFWDKRKREAGKLGEKSRLHPRFGKKLGKAQFNWRPTLDLKNFHKSAYFAWGIIIIAGFSLGALFIPQAAYSPGGLSSSHTSDQPPARGLALDYNGASCTMCHSPAGSINQNCTGCHTTNTFQPKIYDKHQTERMGCVDCHAEHRGSNIHAALITYGICSSCHNGTYTIRYGDRAGGILPVPHGGGVGYPVVDGKWIWKGLAAAEWKARGLQENLAGYSIKDQFHLVHQVGRMQSRMKCTDCHTAGVPAPLATDNAPRAECAKCHGLSLTGGNTVRLQANCSTCHQQHGQSMDTAALVAASSADNNNIKKYIASLNAPDQSDGPKGARPIPPLGGARAIRQDPDSLGIDSLSNVGAVPWFGWIVIACVLPLLGLVAIAADSFRTRRSLNSEPSADQGAGTPSLSLSRALIEGPSYPHPVINAELCIGCHACVEACPHDVLAIVDGIASPIALDQCMEDTSCQVECPTNPKACIVVNTKKKIPPRKVPVRNQRFMTNVAGIYLIGDVSGVPLIKNAVNEGAQVLDCILEDLNQGGATTVGVDYDVAIIGMGPAGLSAAVLARKKGLRVLALEQDTVASTIANYPAGKYVFFKPDTVVGKGGLPIPGAGEHKEDILKAWDAEVKSAGLDIHEQESCVDIKQDDNVFLVITEKGKARQPASYAATRIILAIGNRGAPMKLGVPGEDQKLSLPPDPKAAAHCPSCGGPRRPGQRFCPRCGAQLDESSLSQRLDDKVKYKLQDPDDYSGKKCIIVGAGNSAIEAAVDLCGFKRDGHQISFIRDNEVTLVVRSDFKGDLKLGNKMNVYDCMDAGKIKVYFRTGIKEMTEKEVVLIDIGSKEEKARIANDYVFALIGAEKPIKFLQSLGIKIAG